MANLVLKTHLHNSKFNAEYKSLSLPLENNVIELLLTPKPGYKINAEDFYNGFLPETISDITYQDSRNNVIAFVTIKNNLATTKNYSVSLPINCNSTLEKDDLELTKILDVSDDIIVNTIENYNSSKLDDRTIYDVDSSPGEKVLIFDQKFVVTGDSYFSKDPSYKIEGNTNRYHIITTHGTDTSGKTNFKLFKVYYTSPKNLSAPSKDTITFEAKSSKPSTKIENLVATTKEEEEIYSYTISKDPGSGGGVRWVKIKGIPMSTFKILLSDSTGKMYDSKTGTFSETGSGILEGVIPFPEDKKPYGLYHRAIRIPKATTAVTYKEQFISDKPIDHDSIVSPATADIAANPVTSGTGVTETVVAPTSVITLSVDHSSGFNAVKTGADGDSDFVIKGNYGKASEGFYSFKFIVTPSTSTSPLVIERQPVYAQYPLIDVDIDEELTYTYAALGIVPYNNWDSGSDKAAAKTSTGVVIYSDWAINDDDLDQEHQFVITAKATGIGEPGAAEQYSEVIIEGNIAVTKFGKGDITATLDLLNFLTPTAL